MPFENVDIKLFAKRIFANPIRLTMPMTGPTPKSGSLETVGIWWAELPKPAGRRPMLLLSRDDAYAVLSDVVAAALAWEELIMAQGILRNPIFPKNR